MSLKAYNGMMTRKGFSYIQDKIKENLPLFKKASENQILKAYVDIILAYTDKKDDIFKHIKYLAINENKIIDELSKIEKTKETTILSFIYQAAKILTKAYYINDFCVHLHLTLESVNKSKILVYPNLLVPEHEQILLSFLTDWYAQDQSDPDEKVSKKEWNQRSKDWRAFNNTKGYEAKITLFDPNHYNNGIVMQLRGEELINGIISNVPSDDKRKDKILRNKFIEILINRFKSDEKDFDNDKVYYGVKLVNKALDYLNTDIGKEELENYKNNTPIELIKINKEFLNKIYND